MTCHVCTGVGSGRDVTFHVCTGVGSSREVTYQVCTGVGSGRDVTCHVCTERSQKDEESNLNIRDVVGAENAPRILLISQYGCR